MRGAIAVWQYRNNRRLKRCLQESALWWDAKLSEVEGDGGLVVSYRRPSGPAAHRRGGWSARLQPAWRSPHWGRWSRPRRCIAHWSYTRWERRLAEAAGGKKKKSDEVSKCIFNVTGAWKHQGEPTKQRRNNALGKDHLIKPAQSESNQKFEERSRAHAVLRDLKPTRQV